MISINFIAFFFLNEMIIYFMMISDWKILFDKVKEREYSRTLRSFLDEEYKRYVVYPPRDLMYNAFSLTSPSSIKAVIIGQDPYHNPGQAMGMSFSVPRGIEPPPSLINIYKEMQNELGIEMDMGNGDLSPWAKQGVLLLNAYLTVRENAPLSHKREEYDLFMADVMEYLDSLNQPIVFFLWGGFAKRYEQMIKNPNHLIIKSVHPSPLSANRGGWFGTNQFARANEYLRSCGLEPIDWSNK